MPPLPQRHKVLPPSAHVSVASQSDVRAILKVLKPADLTVLEPALEGRLQGGLWRTTLPIVLPTLGSVFTCNYNVEPAGLMVVERRQVTANIRLLAVAPDLRRRGIATKMLRDLEPLVRSRHLRWLWTEVPSDNAPATRLALSTGFRRVQPQFLRRDVPTLLQVSSEVVAGVAIELLDPRGVARAVTTAMQTEVQEGDAWVQELLEIELFQRMTLPVGDTYVCFARAEAASGDRKLGEVGLAHLSGTKQHTTIHLWLDQAMWGQPAELGLLKLLLNTVLGVPRLLDVRLGSSGHLRASADSFKAVGFAPVIEPRVVFAKRLAEKG